MGVRLRLSKPDLLEDLLLFLERRGCPARQLAVDLIEVEVPTRSTPSRRAWNSTSTSTSGRSCGARVCVKWKREAHRAAPS
jgi:hypothetical protein